VFNKYKKEMAFLVAILILFLTSIALSAVPTETWYGIKVFYDGLYVSDANTIVIDPNGFTSSVPFNNVTITDPGATGATLTIVTGKTLYCTDDATISGTVSGENTGDQDLSGKVDQSSGKSATVHNSIDFYGTDSTEITFPASTCSLAAVISGKAATIHNSIDLYGTDSTEITLPAVTSSLFGIDPNGLSSCAEDIYGIYLKDTETGTIYRVEVVSGELYATSTE